MERGLVLVQTLRQEGDVDAYLDLAKAAGLAELGSHRQSLLALERLGESGYVDDEFQSLRLAYLAFCRRQLGEDGAEPALERARRLRPHCIVRDRLGLS